MEKYSLSKKEVNKLLNSEYLKNINFVWLYDLLEIDKSLDFSDIPIEKKDVYSETIQDILLKCSDEWIQTKGPNGQPEEDMGDNEENWKNCSLCNTPNRFIFYIENTLNKIKINVGSECIKEFGSIAGAAQKSKTSMQKTASRARRLQDLLEIIPGVRTTVDKWEDFIIRLPILLSSKETDPYQDIGLQANNIFEKILNSGLKNDYVAQLKKLIRLGEDEKKKVLNRINELKKNDFVLTHEQVKWIRSNQPDKINEIIKMIKSSEDSLITLYSAPLINENTFLKTFSRKYNSFADNHNEDILDLYTSWQLNDTPAASEIEFENELPKITNVNSGSFSFEFTSIPRVTFTLSSKKFISSLGFIVFTGSKKVLSNTDVLQIITEAQLPSSIINYENFFSQIMYVANKPSYTGVDKYLLYKVSLEKNYVDFRIYISSTKDEDDVVTYRYAYRRYSLKPFFNSMKGVLLKKNKNNILNYLEKKHINHFTEEQYVNMEREELELSKMNR
ncbi:hypothetical protein HCJ66_11360 [Listeria sp. FSL L7-1582]|uniref:hypothetical protein n=1 Tax=Listeria portnoyi TaxID=2713504 RepID=UPI00164D2373|nr:hypothetical protein [Listeria portnoyi]MBC6310135.1 hypothetical protein [Listeria portnoyi]